MADLFDKTRKPKPSATPVPAAPTGGRDLFGNAAKAKPAPQRQADSGVISDKAAAELKAAAVETAERMKAGAGKLADQAGELASKAKSTWVPAVKTRVSEVQMTRKTWMLSVGVLVAIAGGVFAWHMHQATPAPQTTTASSSSSTAAKAPALGVESSTPAPAPVMKLPGWNVQAGLQVLNTDTGPKQALTCTLAFNPNVVAGGWSHTAATIPGLIQRVDDQHGVVQASTADVAQQALAAADFALEAKCLTPAQMQAQVKPPVAPVEAPKPAPVPTFVPQKAPAPVVAAVAKPTPAPVVSAPVAKPVAKAKPKAKAEAKPDTFERDADAKLDAFFKQH